MFLDDEHFVVADDESNVLRVYQVDRPKYAIRLLDMSSFLKVDPASPEADIEAAAKVDDRIYWISSHGRNKSGKIRPNRYRFFCTQIKPAPAGSRYAAPILVPVGTPCRTLMHQFIKYPSSAQQLLVSTNQLDPDLSKKKRTKLAPKEGGLNIEGMMVYPPNKSLLIGLRNPLYPGLDGKQNAIVIELLNPAEVVEQGAISKFGKVLNWDLDNRGIRSMEYNPADKQYYIVAGPVDSETTFALYQWTGDLLVSPKKKYQWPQTEPEFKPEAIALHPLTKALWFFSDDGTRPVPVKTPAECKEGELLEGNVCPNKFLLDVTRQSFRVQRLF